MACIKLEVSHIQDDELDVSLLGHGSLLVHLCVGDALLSSVAFEELEHDVLLLVGSFVAFVGFSEVHFKEASLLVPAHDLAFDDLEGFFFAIDFGEN